MPRLRIRTRLSTHRLPPLRLQCWLRTWRLSSALPDIPIQLAAKHGLSVKRYAASNGSVSLLCPQGSVRLLHEIALHLRGENPSPIAAAFRSRLATPQWHSKARPHLEERALSHSYSLGSIPCWHLYCCFMALTWRATRRGSRTSTRTGIRRDDTLRSVIPPGHAQASR